MTDNLIPKKVRDIEEYRPNLTPCRVRLDANESPYLPSKAVLDELAAAVYGIDFNRYPDPYATELIEMFANIYDVDAKNTVAGNGSDELISLICSGLTEPGDTVTVVLPDFSMYEFYSTLAGAEAVRYIKSDSFEVDFDELFKKADANNSKIVIFSNPCNPTGWVCKREDIVRFIERSSAIVVVDEAYMEFSPVDESVLGLTSRYDNLIVLKTMSKAYGAAALRLGFAVAGDELATSLRKIKSPYNVNTVSQVFGRIILSHADEINSRVAQMKSELSYMRSELEALKSDIIERICPTAANFVYMKLTTADLARSVYETLMSKGVAIRCMRDGYLRVCVGTREENDIFLEKFKEALV